MWLAVTLAVGPVGCGDPEATETRSYTMQGQILSVAPERKETLVKHEIIAGFMEAMTMPYYVRDVQELAGLRPGDLITSTLVVEESGTAYLRDITKVGDAPLERPMEATSSEGPSATLALALLDEGDPAPDATFVDQDGASRAVASFRGSIVVLTFIYTRCPLPQFCPLMDRHFVALQAKLAQRPALKNVHLVTVSFDPRHDTPEVLRRHAATLGADRARWTFLTGQSADIEAFARRFGVSVMRDATAADITHNLRTAIIDATGTVVKVYSGNDWTPDQLLADLTDLGR